MTEPNSDSRNASPARPDGSSSSLRNHFLVALPTLENDYFANTVTYMVEHTDEGAFGLVINRPLQVAMGELFGKAGFKGLENSRVPVLDGGPVRRDSVFFLHETGYAFQYTQQVSPEVSLTTSVDLVRSLASGHGPGRVLTIMGYAGWDAGQLEEELADNVWLVSPSRTDIIFEAPYAERAQLSAALLGIDLNLISTHAGHG